MSTTVQQKKVKEYNNTFDEKDIDKRLTKAQNVTNNFYDLITKFYEKGWGNHFILLRDIKVNRSMPV